MSQIKMEDLTLIIGRRAIAHYVGVHVNTLDRWIRKWAFPAAPLPSSKLATSVFLVDAWLQARGRQYKEVLNVERETRKQNQR